MNKKPKRSSHIYNNILYGTLLAMGVTGTFTYILLFIGKFSNIEPSIFMRIILVLVLVLLIYNMLYLIGFSKSKPKVRKVFFNLGFVLLIFGIVGSFYIFRANRSLNRLIQVDSYETVEYSVIGFSETDTTANMDNGTMGFIEHDEEFDTIMQDAVRPYSRVVQYLEYKDYHSMLDAALRGEIQYALVPKDYSRLDESFSDMNLEKMPLENAHTLFTFSTQIDDDFVDVEVLQDPFSVLILGNNGGLSDSIIVATINPKTLNVTMTSLARDTYIPIACYPNKTRDKLNHARAKGRQCLEDTVEDYLGFEIDFYFETDFYALQKIVDALGGLELESPVEFWGSLPQENNVDVYDEIFIPEGRTKMNGKQVVTFARERKHMPRGDFDRQMNQQYVISELASAIIKERNPEKLVSSLEGASQNIRTNLSIDTITKLLGFAIQQIDVSPLDALGTFRIEQSQILGTTPMINGMSVIVPYKNELKAAQDLIIENMQTEPTLNNIREFTYNINEPYKTPTQKRSPWGDQAGGTIDIGNVQTQKPGTTPQEKPNTQPADLILVPDFTNPKTHTKNDLEQWAKNNGITLNVKTISTEKDGNPLFYSDSQIINQAYAGEKVSLALLKEKGLNVTYAKQPDQPVTKPEVPESNPSESDTSKDPSTEDQTGNGTDNSDADKTEGDEVNNTKPESSTKPDNSNDSSESDSSNN